MYLDFYFLLGFIDNNLNKNVEKIRNGTDKYIRFLTFRVFPRFHENRDKKEEGYGVTLLR